MSTVHPLHSICPYFAMFPPGFVERYVLAFTDPGEIVFDPFSGRGTTIFESLLLGRQAFGLDINPVAACVSAAKAEPPAQTSLLNRIEDLRARFGTCDIVGVPETEFFAACYAPQTLLRGRRALVTGGDSGIGRAAVIAFAREGAAVAINYHPREDPDAQDLRQLLESEGLDLVLLPGDLTDEGFCTKVIGDAAKKLGGLDILVNNAAYQQSKSSIAEITSEQFDRTMKTNVYAPFWLSKAAAARMQPGSSIINTASVNSFNPGEELLDYATTKGAIEIFTKGLAKQLAAKGIRVNAVAPGPVWTPLQVAGGQLPGKLGEFGQDTPLKRAGQPAELASLYVVLADNHTSFTTGSVFGANGGTGAV
ncbi:SDR family oxidoreductase [Novosphingobium sp. JCM 18896]|uniref:SDR family oxidoreductase n=1 Tax=Novosphingobium sp. JCM 18896 TaxID=2989731 RepID=UPI002223281B|nr:SDR family oxidoreductase [Novosphingobium sp. JCM 18896]MCW1432078.1 SDR family oxidoreductase [Novosphingobium sp. JCM 18896]